jgi:hypothetical protein
MPLPADFQALEPYLDWDLPGEPERYAKRLESTMDELQEFYDVAFPLLEPALAHLDDFPLDELPEAERSLAHILQALITISFPVEAWRQPRVPDSGAAYIEQVAGPDL